MNKTLFICILSWTFAWAALAAQRVKTDIDWPSFLGRQDMVWNVLPEQWYESAYMGNGELGLMMYKEPGENWLRLEVSNCRLHDHRPGTGLLANPRLFPQSGGRTVCGRDGPGASRVRGQAILPCRTSGRRYVPD